MALQVNRPGQVPAKRETAPKARERKPRPKKKTAPNTAASEFVKGVRLEYADERRVDEVLRALGLVTDGDLRARVDRLAQHWLDREPTDGSGDYEQCDRCGGSQDQAATKALVGEACIYCGSVDGAEPVVPSTATVSQLRVALAEIDLEHSPPMRAALDDEAIELYSSMLDELPPVELVRAGGRLLVADGWHRIRAAERAKRDAIAAVVRGGTERDALLAALAANRGVRRTPDDLRVVVAAALGDAEIAGWSDRQIAAHIGCSDRTVNRARKSSDVEQPSERVGADGKTRRPPKPRQTRAEVEAERAKITAEAAQVAAEHPDRVSLALAFGEVTLELDAKRRAEERLPNDVVIRYRVAMRAGKPHALVITRERATP